MPSYTIASWRFIIATAALVLLSIFLLPKFEIRLFKQYSRQLFALGIIFGLHIYFYVSSATQTTLMNAAVLFNMSPIFTAIFSLVFFKIRPSKVSTLGIATTLLGAFIIAASELISGLGQNIVGDLLAISASICFALYTTFGKDIRSKINITTSQVSFYGITAITMLAVSLILSPSKIIPVNAISAWALLYLGLIPSTAGHTLYFASLKNLKPYETATLKMLEIVFASTLGYIIFSEKPGPTFVF
jgi:drug/metabolite transporter (DMT)-like permease